MDFNGIFKNIWRALAIIIAILMPIYGAWHHVFTLCICVCMYYVNKGEEEKEKKKKETSE